MCGSSRKRSSSSAVRRDLPTPGSPDSRTTCPSPAFRSAPAPQKHSHSSPAHESRQAGRVGALRTGSRPDSGAAGQARTTWRSLEVFDPRSLSSNNPPRSLSRSVGMTTHPAPLSLASRAARFGVSPTTPRSCASPEPTRRRPRPDRSRSRCAHARGRIATVTSSAPPPRQGKPARTARSASSSCASG